MLLSFSLTQNALLLQHISLTGRENESGNTQSVISITDVNEPNIYDVNGCPGKEAQQWVVGYAIGCEISPNGNLLIKSVYNGLSSPERYYELFIKDLLEGETEHRIYSGDYKTLGWEWVDDRTIEVTYNCGTGCQAVKKIKVDESIYSSNYRNGQMNEENGWQVKFANTF